MSSQITLSAWYHGWTLGIAIKYNLFLLISLLNLLGVSACKVIKDILISASLLVKRLIRNWWPTNYACMFGLHNLVADLSELMSWFLKSYVTTLWRSWGLYIFLIFYLQDDVGYVKKKREYKKRKHKHVSSQPATVGPRPQLPHYTEVLPTEPTFSSEEEGISPVSIIHKTHIYIYILYILYISQIWIQTDALRYDMHQSQISPDFEMVE